MESNADSQCDPSAAMVTHLLNEAGAGNAQASADLLPLVYEKLRALAGRKMREERPDHTLQPTALVHEAYVRLVDATKEQQWEGRWHFFAAAAEAMRRILVDKARSRRRHKRGGDLRRIDLDKIEPSIEEPSDQLIELDEALCRFTEKHPEKAQLIKLRYFGGLTNVEAAQALGISTSTADRHWAFARAWLYRQMAQDKDAGDVPERLL